jgi:hypothetical protein
MVIWILQETVDFLFSGKEEGEVPGLAAALEGGIAVRVGAGLDVVAHGGLLEFGQKKKRHDLKAAPSVFLLYIDCRKRKVNYVQSGRKMLVFRISGLETIFRFGA